MIAAGAQLTVILGAEGAAVSARLALKSGPDVARLFCGRSPADVARLVPLIFNLCAGAQARAARAALDLEDGNGPDDTIIRQDHVRDHALCLARAWPAALDGPTDDRLLTLVSAWTGGDTAAARAIRRHLIGDGDGLAELSLRDLADRLRRGTTPLLRLLDQARRAMSPEWGRVALPAPDEADVTAHLQGAAVPPRETSCLDAVGTAPVLAALIADEGRSLFVRMLARVLDLLRCLDPHCALPAGWRPAPGIGLAHAVRGILGHAAAVDGGRVTAYRVVTPTHWNLAPGGPIVRALETLPASGDLAMLARLTLSCLNPCVPTVIVTGGRRLPLHA